MAERFMLIGAGGHAKIVAAAARYAGQDIVEVQDDCGGRTIAAMRVNAPIQRNVPDFAAHIAIGNNDVRRRLSAERRDWSWLAVVHPRAWIDPSVDLGRGGFVGAGACVQVDSVIGDHVIVNTGANIDHDCVIGAFAHVAPGAAIAGGVRIGEGVLVGAGAAIIPEISIGAWATIGAGAVVIRNVPAGATVVGNPARILR